MNRESTKWIAPDITNVTAKLFQVAEHLKSLSKGEIQMPANTYDDVDKYGFIPSNLFWDEASLYYSLREIDQPSYVKEFLTFDARAPLRGNYKRTEIGIMLPEIIKKDDLPKPGSALTTPKQYYVPTYQDLCADIEDIHLRSLVDDHMFDFVQHFNTHDEYFAINRAMMNAANQSIQLAERLFVDAFLLSCFGGFLHFYPVGSPLWRFFTEEENGWVPDEQFSKLGKTFYDKDGEFAKAVKSISKNATKRFISKSTYLTNVVRSEIPARAGKNLDVPKYGETLLPDFSTAQKALETARDWYLDKEPNEDKWKKVPETMRRTSLMAFASALQNTIDRMRTLDVRNHAAYDFYKEHKEKVLYPLAASPSRLMVFMNNGDYRELKWDLVGSPAKGMFTDEANGTIYGLEQEGVTFYGLPFLMPGCAIIIDRLAFSIKEYYSGDFQEFRPYHLVTSKIKHVKKKPVMYSHVVFEALVPAKGQKYAVPAGWASENLPLLVKDA